MSVARSSSAGREGAAAPGKAAIRLPASAARVVAVAGLAALAAAHWAALIEDPPAGRLVTISLLAALGALLMAASAELAPRPVARVAARVALVVAITIAGLVLAGIELRLLLPGGYDELGEGIDRGLAGLRDLEWPYAGLEPWSRLVLVAGLAVLVVPGAALACWPAGRGAWMVRALGVALLVSAYAVPVTNVGFGAEILRGAVLALLVGLWLATPRIGRRSLPGLAALAAATLVALPVAAALDAEKSWFDYRSWNWFGTTDGTTYEWDHTYGPIDWPRDGKTLLEVRSDRPLYWRTQTLDRFDGFTWTHSRENESTALSGELPSRLPARWLVRDLKFTVRNLRTVLVPVAGIPLSVRGAGPINTTQDGTTTSLGEPLEEGAAYEVDAYAPDPSARAMRAAPAEWPESVRKYVRIGLPRPGEGYLDGVGRAGDAARSAAADAPSVAVPFRGETFGDPLARRELEASPYERVHALARRLAAGSATSYDAVRAIERHLRRNYSYSERPPSHDYPLHSFLFEDRIGYCQHFSGVMALMLRMNGIPARVAVGFSPGSFNRDTRTFRVRDLDAHSWVEVYFTGIGWVPFDPTPSGTPAASRARPEQAASATGSTDPGRGGVAAERSAATPAAEPVPEPRRRTLPIWALAAVAGLLAGVVALRQLVRVRRQRGGVDGSVRELERALRRLGFGLPPSTTLLSLERRLARTAGPAAAGYARSLRLNRYSATAPEPPGHRDRRELRRALSRRGGIVWRLRCLVALPPG